MLSLIEIIMCVFGGEMIMCVHARVLAIVFCVCL